MKVDISCFVFKNFKHLICFVLRPDNFRDSNLGFGIWDNPTSYLLFNK